MLLVGYEPGAEPEECDDDELGAGIQQSEYGSRVYGALDTYVHGICGRFSVLRMKVVLQCQTAYSTDVDESLVQDLAHAVASIVCEMFPVAADHVICLRDGKYDGTRREGDQSDLPGNG